MVCGLSRRQNVKKQFCLSAVSPAVNFVDRLSDLPMLKDTSLRLSEAPEMKCAVPVFPSSQYDHNLPLLRHPPFCWSFHRFKQFLRA